MKKLLVVFFLLIASLNAQTISENVPHLERRGNAEQLIINGKPFLMLAGETGNSSASTLKYFNAILPGIVKMHLNTLLVPVYWELIEPSEGNFNFVLVDSIIASARASNLKLVFLWFGSWKNSMSCYVPGWIKKDAVKFPRAKDKNGNAEEILTPFNDMNRDTDANAFAALMKHIRTIDEKEQTVVMVQVENEIGMIPSARDYCDDANKFFNSKVPDEFINYIKENREKLNPDFYNIWKQKGFRTSGNWEEIFGKGTQTDEIFMAWFFAKYTDYVAKAGKEQYPLPMYVNAALIRPGYKPGQYPSAGPLPHLMDIWKAAAPHIDFLSPDVYFGNFAEWISKFHKPNNPLFIPEVANTQSMANAYYAFAQHNAIGYSPFSIESLPNSEDNQVSKAYDILSQLSPIILENQGKGTMAGILLDSINEHSIIHLGEYTFRVNHEYSWKYAKRAKGETPRVGGMIIMLSPDEFIIAGSGIIITFEPNNDSRFTGIYSLEDGFFQDGKWITEMVMNGDQSNQGRQVHLPGGTFGIQRLTLYKY